MGLIAALNFTEGITHNTKTSIMKLLLLTVFVAVALAEEAAEEAKPEAPAAVVPAVAVHPFYGLWGHQQQWPGIRAPGFSATCFGCRGKRSAEAPAAAPALVFGSGHNSAVGRTIWGFPRSKRSAEPGYYGYPYGFYGYPYYHALKPLKSGTAVHPGHATSFVSSSGASPI